MVLPVFRPLTKILLPRQTATLLNSTVVLLRFAHHFDLCSRQRELARYDRRSVFKKKRSTRRAHTFAKADHLVYIHVQ